MMKLYFHSIFEGVMMSVPVNLLQLQMTDITYETWEWTVQMSQHTRL